MRETPILYESYSMVRQRARALQDERSPQVRLSDVVTSIIVLNALAGLAVMFLIDFRERR